MSNSLPSFAQEMPTHLVRPRASRSAGDAGADPGHSISDPARSISDNDTLRLIQQLYMTPQPPRATLFAGVEQGNGCSQICASVGKMLVMHAQRTVCLVEANVRSPALADIFGVSSAPGLTDSLVGEEPIRFFAKPVIQESLWLLPCGARFEDSDALLSSARFPQRLAELRKEFDLVIIDAPNLTEYSDALALGQFTDGMVMVLEAGSTRRETAQVVSTSIRSAGIPILAAVLNKRTFSIPEMIYKHL